MRSSGVLSLVLAVAVAALLLAQDVAGAAAKRKRPAPASAKDTYAAMATDERVAIQADLVWAGHYNGMANGEFGDNSVAAVKAFQGELGNKATGVLNPQERGQLAEIGRGRRDAAGWRVVDDPATGARLGLAAKMVPQSSAGPDGTRWRSAHGEVQVETARIEDGGATLAAVFERQKKEPSNRRVDYSVLRPDFFVVSGLQGLKKFYVRGAAGEGEVRAMTILYDQAMEGVMAPVVIAMSGAFVAFAPNARPRVGYGTGIAVTASGYVLTDRDLVAGCRAIVVGGRGHAEPVGEDAAAGLALLRINGASDLRPLAIAAPSAAGSEVTLVGIAEPARQDGGGAITAPRARLVAAGEARLAEPAPGAGFSGAAVIDASARFLGMLALRPRAGDAGAAPAQGQAQIQAQVKAPVKAQVIDAGTVRRFLAAQRVAVADTRASVDDARAAVLRVICVRR
ncbi:MAG: trypsin-like peptidase domain-containing protein [Proteobacteria bacterium]|nr:trypsin-like peptidase domain-containing protein [Pseudomonadota bacterium]